MEIGQVLIRTEYSKNAIMKPTVLYTNFKKTSLKSMNEIFWKSLATLINTRAINFHHQN